MATPGELVCPSNESSQGSANQRFGTLVQKRTQNTIRWHAFLFVLWFLRSSLAEPPVQRLKGPACLESHWGPQKYCRNQSSRNQAPHLESWRTQAYYTRRPRGVNTLSSEPQTKGLQSFCCFFFTEYFLVFFYLKKFFFLFFFNFILFLNFT